jgi:RND family efflux transporter MFP subunit
VPEGFKTLRAPFDGVVTERNTDVGALVDADTTTPQPLFVVSDLQTVRIYVDVPQSFLGQLHDGTRVAFTMPQFPDRRFDATLVTTANALNQSSRSMRVERQADNADGLLTAGSYCEVEFDALPEPNVVRVPATALIFSDRGVEVATLSTSNKIVLKPVELGRNGGTYVEGVSGLSASDRVIDNPPETILNGMAARLASSKTKPARPRPLEAPRGEHA